MVLNVAGLRRGASHHHSYRQYQGISRCSHLRGGGDSHFRQVFLRCLRGDTGLVPVIVGADMISVIASKYVDRIIFKWTVVTLFATNRAPAIAL